MNMNDGIGPLYGVQVEEDFFFINLIEGRIPRHKSALSIPQVLVRSFIPTGADP